jgi:hypothetical protein
MRKAFPTTLIGSARAWYHNLELESILHFHNLISKIISHFSTNISTKKSTIKLFAITQREDESTKAYLQRFNKEMIWIKSLNSLPQKL